MYGPIQFTAIGFTNDKVIDGLLHELEVVRRAGTIRVIDFLFVGKDKYGNIYAREVSDLTMEEKEEFGAVVGGLIGLGAAGEEGAVVGAMAGALSVSENDFGLLGEDIKEIIRDIPKGTSAMIILFEHAWAIDLKRYVLNVGGVLLAQGLIHPSALIAVGEELAEAVEAEKMIEQEETEMLKARHQTSTKKLKTEKKAKARAK